ncbi:hypothetical protein DVU_0190 [Nitratidesulfovibrio vulgaris str. Hildenborough]|uniref:Uncharacterized protein n=1 Tax=Nitratidesulfovibrio vulgaris (strain ATCC 29579 / DSM 644 / CCUG 34227 / NCIMB 8303 / VKM B-1760 / Hildenborough) TaxID=882 RepID=Q72FM3_NITV2|nr:hypothetical protein DVU_0190 [Nitratidesulfovibrio vulgaris str. Hildenborough]
MFFHNKFNEWEHGTFDVGDAHNSQSCACAWQDTAADSPKLQTRLFLQSSLTVVTAHPSLRLELLGGFRAA